MIEYIKELEVLDNKEREKYVKKVLDSCEIPFYTQKVRGFFNVGENIIVDYPSDSFNQKTKYILLGAHHNKFNSPGANDNGSGVSVLLAFLKKLHTEKPSNLNIRVVFFAKEDSDGIMAGSRKYVQEYGINNIDYFYNVDMVGMGNTLLIVPVKESMITEYWVQQIFKSANRAGLSVQARESISLLPGFSDDIPFRWKGLRHVCTLLVIPNEDEKFQYIFNRFSLYWYWMTGLGNIPKLTKHYHNKDDRSEFVEEKTLQKILETLWGSIISDSLDYE